MGSVAVVMGVTGFVGGVLLSWLVWPLIREEDGSSQPPDDPTEGTWAVPWEANNPPPRNIDAPAPSRDRVEVYLDTADEWRWRLKARNGEPIAHGEAHTRKADAVRAARRVCRDGVEVRFVD